MKHKIKFLENSLVQSKTKCFFLLPHFLMYVIPVLQHCEFYEDIRGESEDTFPFSLELNLWLNILNNLTILFSNEKAPLKATYYIYMYVYTPKK